MPLSALGAALEPATPATQRLDLIVAQAPLLGNLDVAAALAEAADYLVAAPDQIWQLNLAERILPLLSGVNRANPQAVARTILNSYDSAVGALGGNRARSLAVYDLSQALNARGALETLGRALEEDLQQNAAGTQALLDQLPTTVQVYDSSANGMLNMLSTPSGVQNAREDALFDADEAAQQIAESALVSETSRNAATELRAALSGSTPLIIAQIQRSGIGVHGQQIDLSGESAISLFLPAPSRLGQQDTLSYLALYAGSGWEGEWNDFLRTYLAPHPAGGVGGITVGPAGNPYFLPPSGGIIGLDLWLPLVGKVAAAEE